MGSVNYSRTSELRLRNINYAKNEAVVCSEISRSYNTPENKLLALILFSIMMYCDKCLTMERMVLSSDQIYPTINKLQVIRSQIAMLLSERSIKQILPISLESINNINNLFGLMIKRIQSGRTPLYFIKIYNLFYKWKYYSILSLNDSDVVKDVLQYHFMKLKDENDLYECWIFCKILYALSNTYDLKFVEVNSSQTTKVWIASFSSSDGSLQITYQPVYATDWEDKFSSSLRSSISSPHFLRDIPDISIDIPANDTTIIIDAKNSHIKRHSKPNLDQMRSYMETTKAKYGIFVHSDSEDQDLFEYIHRKHTQEQIIWTSISPGPIDYKNDKTINKIVEIVENHNHKDL
jgi:hypothetical protein